MITKSFPEIKRLLTFTKDIPFALSVHSKIVNTRFYTNVYTFIILIEAFFISKILLEMRRLRRLLEFKLYSVVNRNYQE